MPPPFHSRPGRAALAGALTLIGGFTASPVPGFAEVPPATTSPAAAPIPAEPLKPAWQQLRNGSIDGRLIEIRGLVEKFTPKKHGWMRLELRMAEGVLKVDYQPASVRSPEPLEQYENAVVRLRGVMRADWTDTGRVKTGQIRLLAPEVFVDEPAPADLFSLPTRRASSLMRYDPGYDPARRVKIAGQVVAMREGIYFLMDGADGVRFVAKNPPALQAGDLVEVVGFPEVSAAAPVLYGAVARKVGQAPLPAPRRITAEELVRPTFDSTRVSVEAVFVGLLQTPDNLALELQAGSWRFRAQLGPAAKNAATLRAGSRLDLTGVYCAQGEYKVLGRDVAAVDLLVSEANDIHVLEQPSWWTLPRLLVVTGVLIFLLLGTILWISLLRRQVEQRTRELRDESRERERVEHLRALEQERSRIARDLHDELGAGITEIGMLAERARADSTTAENRGRHLEQMNAKAHGMVTALDGIVWAMNPAHDSLASLVSYFALHAERFLGLANIAWRLDEQPDMGDPALASLYRHELFLAFKEALTNVVRHARATEVRLGIRVQDGMLQLSIADNGRGMSGVERPREGHGLDSMRARLERLGGRLAITVGTDHGTTLILYIPVR